MKKYSTIDPSPTPPPQEVDVDAVLKSIDSQFELAQNLTKSLDSINQEISSNAKMINGLLERANEICEKVKTFDFHAKLSDESKMELNQYHLNFRERLEQQLSAHASQIDELINNYQIKHEELLETYLKKFDNKKGVWISIKIFWLIFILIGLLLSLTVWFGGQTLTK